MSSWPGNGLTPISVAEELIYAAAALFPSLPVLLPSRASDERYRISFDVSSDVMALRPFSCEYDDNVANNAAIKRNDLGFIQELYCRGKVNKMQNRLSRSLYYST